MKRLEYIRNKVDWFDNTRSRKTLEEMMQDWKEYVKRSKNAKKFLLRSVKGIDNLVKNDAFTTWKNAMYQHRKQIYVMNIEELGRR
jgi:hypothetical protein